MNYKTVVALTNVAQEMIDKFSRMGEVLAKSMEPRFDETQYHQRGEELRALAARLEAAVARKTS